MLAKKRFLLTSDREQFDVTLELHQSGAFQYGNQHCILLRYNNKKFEPHLFDARYDPRFNTVEGFNQNALEFLKQWSDPSFTVQEIEEE